MASSVPTKSAQDAINEKIKSLNSGDFKAEIKSVDTRESSNGGLLLVLVTGYLTAGKANINQFRHFFQTFILSPRDDTDGSNYFVLNDIFRFTENANLEINDAVAVGAPEQNPPAQKNGDVSIHNDELSQWKRWLMNLSPNQWWN